MGHELRDYQVQTRSAVLKEFETVNSTLVVWPTGCGKTVLAAEIIKHFSPKRSLFLVHRDTLLFQSKETIEHHARLRCDIEMAEHRAGGDLFERATCVVATVQTLINGEQSRLKKFDPKDFSLLVVDEGHHYTSPGWRKPLDYFREGNPDLKVLGITATPDRADEQALGQIFSTVAFDYEILDAIHGGWLVPIDQQMVKINGLDYSHIRVTAGDLNGSDLAKVMENEKNCQGIAGASIEIIGQRQTVVFTASVAQAEALANIFNRNKPNCAEWIYEKTPRDERKEILNRFRTKQTQIIANCGILTEGWDDRGVEVCVMARPTRSRSLYAQMVGRILRPLEGIVDGPNLSEERKAAIASSPKPSALIVDFVGNSGKHKLMTSADILGGKCSDEAVERATKKATESGEPVRMGDLIDQSEEEIRAEIEKRRQQEEARKAKLVAKVKWQSKQVSPFDVLQIEPVRERGWDMGRQLSEPQRKLLVKQGIDPDSMPYAQARQVINEIFSRWNNKQCSFRQARILKTHGYNTKVSREEASAVIDTIAYREDWGPRKVTAK